MGKVEKYYHIQFSSVQSLSRVRLFATPWTAAHQASLSITNSWSPPKLMCMESVMPSSHLILCRPLLLLPPIPPSIKGLFQWVNSSHEVAKVLEFQLQHQSFQWTPRSNRQIWLWRTEWSRAKTNRVLPRERTGHSKHPLPTQEKTLHMDITRWSTPKSDWLYSLQPKMEKLYTVSKNKTGSWLWLRSWTPYCQIQTEIEESRENH